MIFLSILVFLKLNTEKKNQDYIPAGFEHVVLCLLQRRSGHSGDSLSVRLHRPWRWTFSHRTLVFPGREPESDEDRPRRRRRVRLAVERSFLRDKNVFRRPDGYRANFLYTGGTRSQGASQRWQESPPVLLRCFAGVLRPKGVNVPVVLPRRMPALRGLS